MIIKTVDDKKKQVSLLESLLERADDSNRKRIEIELRNVRAGIKGEQEAAYLIDFDYGQSKNVVVLHDLRLEIGGRVAQIDHLILWRTLEVAVLETKHFHAGVKITEDGEFLRWNDFKKAYEGMASPLEQNERHIAVLRDAFKQLEMPTRLSVRLQPTFQSIVLVSPNSRIDRPRKFDSSRVIKADSLKRTLDKDADDVSVLSAFGGLVRAVSAETLVGIAQQLAALHRPANVDYAAMFGAGAFGKKVLSSTVQPAVIQSSEPLLVGNPSDKPICRACGSDRLSILYGKFGYYFKCAACEKNTPVKVECDQPGHKARIRKEGARFFRECGECHSSALYFENSQGEA